MATTYDKASLVMLPSGVKDGKLYSIKPTSGDGDFTFSRGTDTATRVNASGLIEKERSNQILQSNTFTTTWSTTRASFVSGQAGYDGTNDAWAFVDDANNSTHLSAQSLSLGASVATFSIYAKAGDVDFLAVRFEGSAVDYAYFNLASGTLGTIDSDYIEARITDVGGGWYRCEATRVLAASGNQVVLLSAQANNDPTYAGAGTTAIYIQDAQVEYGLIATSPAIETTSAAVYEGITDNLPRLDYSGGASCPSLLLEPSRTNQITNSEYFNGADWINVDVTATENVARSPEGVQNASQLDFTGTGYKRLEQNTSNAATACTTSIFMKYIDHDIVMARMDSTSGASYAWFNIQTGEVLKVDGATGSVPNPIASVDDYGDGWYRLNTTQSSMAGNQEIFWYFVPDTDTSTGSWTGSGSAYAYGAQFEEGSYPTSYIPTYGASASRAVDDCEVTGASDLIGQSEGTMFLDFVPQDKEFQIIYQIRTTGSSNVGQIDFRYQSSSLRALGTDGASTQFTISYGDIVVGQQYKCAVRYKENDVAFYVNGILVGTDTSASFSSSSLQQVSFSENASNFYPHAEIKQALLFKTPLTNAELAALTTI